MKISVLETINWPGAGLTPETRKKTGDDRFGFDESVGAAWVLDGATDLGPFRIFEREESDAAWIAEYLNRELMTAPPGDEDVRSYFGRVLSGLRQKAEKASRVSIETAPKEVWPIASGMWMHRCGEETDFAWLGDCVALIQPPEGPLEILTKHEQSELETRTSRELNAMSAEDRMAGLRKIRATQNTEPQHVLFGLSPHAVTNLTIETRTLPAETHIFLMSDGLWRVVDPYKMMSPEEMMTTALEKGLIYLTQSMRDFEKGDDQDAASRIKKTDDSSGILLQLN